MPPPLLSTFDFVRLPSSFFCSLGRRFRLPAVFLLLVLQRVPLAPPTLIASLFQLSPAAGGVIRALLCATGLGALHTLAGATMVNVATDGGSGLTVGQDFRLAATVTGSGVSYARAWDVTGNLAPGLSVVGGSREAARIIVAQSDGVLIISGTLTTPGDYTFTLRGWHDTTLTGFNATTTLTLRVTGSAPPPVSPIVSLPVFTQQPSSHALPAGATAILRAAATGQPAPSYQWHHNGVALPGATNPTLVVPNLNSTSTGRYTVTLLNSTGATLSEIAVLDLATGAAPARFANLSVRASAGTGAQTLIVGLTIAGTVSRTLLLRAVGPALSSFGVNDVLPDPRLELYQGTRKLDENEDWSGDPALVTAFAAVGAFNFPSSTSRDAALLVTLPPGGYTVQVSGSAGTSGVALVEAYEVP